MILLFRGGDDDTQRGPVHSQNTYTHTHTNTDGHTQARTHTTRLNTAPAHTIRFDRPTGHTTPSPDINVANSFEPAFVTAPGNTLEIK